MAPCGRRSARPQTGCLPRQAPNAPPARLLGLQLLLEGIKRGLESMKRRKGKLAEHFFEEFFTEKGISEQE